MPPRKRPFLQCTSPRLTAPAALRRTSFFRIPANPAFRSSTASTTDLGSCFNLFWTGMAQPRAIFRLFNYDWTDWSSFRYAAIDGNRGAIVLGMKHVPRIHCSGETR